MNEIIKPEIQKIIDATVHQVIYTISHNNRISFDEAKKLFVRSNTYKLLTSPETELWQESTAYIVYEYNLESVQEIVTVSAKSFVELRPITLQRHKKKTTFTFSPNTPKKVAMVLSKRKRISGMRLNKTTVKTPLVSKNSRKK